MKRPSPLRWLVRLFFAAVLLVVAAGAAATIYFTQPYQGFQKEVFLNFDKGTSTAAMADQLAQSGVIRDRWLFLAVRALRPHTRLQAGEYQFLRPASVWTVFDRITRGDVFYYEVTIPEGSNIFDEAAIIDRLGFIKGADFLKVARNPALIRDLAPEAPSLEGYMFPSTYRFTRRTSAHQVARMMTDLFRRRWRELTNGQTVPVNRMVTLASLVEKETGVPEERPRVASVLLNRMRIGMALDCDPTTIYAAMLDGRYRGTIYRSDLENDSPYNTYRHAGLPPGPISNPGLASLKAVLHPEETNYLYFVARGDGSGGHNFSSSLAEHDRHVAEYRKTQR